MKSKADQELISTLSKDHQDIITFKHGGEEFFKNTKIRDFLNKLLSADIKSVYTVSKKYDTTHGLDWSGESIILVNAKDEVVYLTNSEWAAFGLL